MEEIPAPSSLRKVLFAVIGYTVFFYLFFLLFNTSFTIMGVDVGDYLKQYLGDFFGVYLFSTFKVFSASLVFHFALGILFHYSLESVPQFNIKKQIPLLLTYLFAMDLLGLFHSITLYPQIYGEFFFYRYSSLSSLLYFFTDHFSPVFFFYTIVLILSVQLANILYYVCQEKTKLSFFYLTTILIVLLFHRFGSLYPALAFIFIFPILHKLKDKIHIRTYFLLIPFLIFLFPFPFLFDFLYGTFTEDHKDKPPVFLISADSLRYDKLGFVNGNKEITPNIDLFSKDSFIFHDHHTTIPRTFPSWADLLTGKYSMTHKVRDMFPSKTEKNRIGSKEFPTIGQKLKEIGYKTSAIGSFAADIFPRADFGFDEVLAPNFNAKVMTLQRTAESQLFLLPVVTGSFLGGGDYIEEMDGLSTWGDGKRILDRLKKVIRRSGESSFFLTYFSSVVHFPYTPAYPNYKKFTNPNYYGKYKYLKFVDPTATDKLNNQEIEQIRSLFDSSVYAFDEEFGAIVRFLKDKDLYDKSIIILTADHGEALYEDIHGQGHGEHLRGEAVTKVPLLIKFPSDSKYASLPEREFFGTTSSVDIFPTLSDYFSIPIKQELPGLSLLNVLGQKDWENERVVYSETGIWFSDVGDHFFQSQRIPYPNILELHQVVPEEEFQIMITDRNFQETIAFAKHRSVQNSRYKFIYIPTRKGVLFELYDRKNDPLNTKNIFPNGAIGPSLKENLYSLVKKWEDASQAGEYLLPGTLRNGDL
ncbi:sulfatase family protein [Leptospira ilyithenensis]|uniref:Sulfatase n=1 Tax=Leptospira ilyithenensis TaxID=2484901 RepID=A0A4R9LN50_9LEPT|nr:sulfatase-like hydrolase/transferase [Leptospira ilyithenensis]TGN10065.1 sulfatase [Leptospira ilyithenensis]